MLGRDGIITGLKRGFARDEPDYVGGFVGINKFSSTFMKRLYSYMYGFFRELC